jgi:hypothetical protein
MAESLFMALKAPASKVNKFLNIPTGANDDEAGQKPIAVCIFFFCCVRTVFTLNSGI